MASAIMPGRGTDTLPRDKGGSIPERMLETTDEFLEDCDRLAKFYHDPRPFSMSQIVMAPCQPINCYQETFSETVDFARKRGLRMHTHLGEGKTRSWWSAMESARWTGAGTSGSWARTCGWPTPGN